jgi:hypothetical protein
MQMPSSTKSELDIDASPILDELVRWVKTLSGAGVSPDKAVEVARDFMLASMMAECGEEGYEIDEEYDEDDDEE